MTSRLSTGDICSVLHRWEHVPAQPELFLLMWANLCPAPTSPGMEDLGFTHSNGGLKKKCISVVYHHEWPAGGELSNYPNQIPPPRQACEGTGIKGDFVDTE